MEEVEEEKEEVEEEEERRIIDTWMKYCTAAQNSNKVVRDNH